MGRFFTYCWQHRQMRLYPDGAPVCFAYGSQFTRRGVRSGDAIYIVSVHRGRIHLLSKLLVGAVTPSAEDFRRHVGQNPEPASEYLLAAAYTPARLIPLSEELTRALRFVRGKELVGLAYRGEAQVDRQSLRSVRRLGAASAAALDELLPALQPYLSGEGARLNQSVEPEPLWKAARAYGNGVLPGVAARPRGKTSAQVRKPKQVRFLAGMVHGVWVVVNLHKPGVYRHDNVQVAAALRVLADAIESAQVPLADHDGEVEFER